jgi:hypothetical protein
MVTLVPRVLVDIWRLCVFGVCFMADSGGPGNADAGADAHPDAAPDADVNMAGDEGAAGEIQAALGQVNLNEASGSGSGSGDADPGDQAWRPPMARPAPQPTVTITQAALRQMLLDAASEAATAAVEQERQRTSTYRSSSSAKAKKPDRWDHETVAPRDFLLQLRNYFVADRVPEHDYVTQAITFLKAELQLWLSHYCEVHDLVQTTLTWDQFSHALIVGRGVQHPQETVRDRIGRLRLSPGTAGRYHQQIRAALSDIVDAAYAVSPVELIGFIQRSVDRHYPALSATARLTPEGRPWTDPEQLLLLLSRHDNKLGKRPAPADKQPATHGASGSGVTPPAGNGRGNGHKKRPASGAADPGGDSKKRGPLSKSERQARVDRGECLYCGQPGHKVSDCPQLANKDKKKKQ